jgi:hypothetical protein
MRTHHPSRQALTRSSRPMELSPLLVRVLVLVLLLEPGITPSASADEKAAPRGPDPVRFEPGFTPIISGDSDLGFGFGGVGSLARFRPECEPFCYRLEAMVYLTVRNGEGGLSAPYHDDYIKIDFPRLFSPRLRLYAQLSFGRYSTSGYYGMGNASTFDPTLSSRTYQYDRIYPQLQTRARVAIVPHVSLMFGGAFVYNWINLYEGSKLASDLVEGDARTRSLLRGVRSHALGELNLGWIWDSRDHEAAPTRGMFHELSFRFSPGLATGGDIAYGGLNATGRFFQSLYRDRLVLAVRAMADLLFGQPPFYELARHGGLFPSGAIGGGAAIRGVPYQRYYGKVKLFANVELRAKLIPLQLRTQRFDIGLTLFADTGRTFADYEHSPELDGTGAGLKLGLGGGVRFQWGETFILRADVAWSPDADPVGVYVDVGHVF